NLVAKPGLFQKKLGNTNPLRITNFDDLSSHGNHIVITSVMVVKPKPEFPPAFSASLLTPHVLPTSRPLLLTDTHRQAGGGAANPFRRPRADAGKTSRPKNRRWSLCASGW